MENFMANQKKCEKCGKKYMPNHQSADCPGHERLVDMELNGVKRIRPGRLEPKPDDRLKGFELQVIDETALECGMGWAEENLINVRRIIAKTASILQAEILQLKDEHLDDLAVVGKELERVRAERLDRPELAGQIKQILNKIPYFTSGVRAGDDFIDKLLALIPDDKVDRPELREKIKQFLWDYAMGAYNTENMNLEEQMYFKADHILAMFPDDKVVGEIKYADTNDRGEQLLPILLTRKEFIALPMNVRRRTLAREADKIAFQDKGMMD